MNDKAVEQLHRTLVDAIRRTRPAALHRPVTVAEIYQDLVPYKTARIELGFDMNADYEHALLRLLAGEGDLARIEPREVRDKLRTELESPNPDVGLFRNYAACDVWVNVADEAEAGQPDDVASENESWEVEFLGTADDAGAPDTPAAGADDEEIVFEPEAPQPNAARPFEIADKDSEEDSPLDREPAHESYVAEELDSSSCAFCGADLPGGRIINFCPFCGTDQSQQPCPSCGEMLDPLWRFCISCGARARPLGDHVN